MGEFIFSILDSAPPIEGLESQNQSFIMIIVVVFILFIFSVIKIRKIKK